jgi:hypothetical protein
MMPATEKSVIMALYSAWGGEGWIKRWSPDQEPCPCVYRWYGLVCDRKGHISDIDLSYNNLTGTIPAAVSTLPWIKTLRLNSNFLTGTIPPELADMDRLTLLHLQGNKFTRDSPKPLVPQVIAKMPSLRDFMISKEETAR